MTLVLVALWAITHVYKGLTGDAELYAVQALAKIRPGLAADLYLQNVSQDRFTIFSPLYAWFIGLLGLQSAALTLTLLLTAGFLGAAWVLARELSTAATAFLAVAALIMLKGTYGSYGVFSYAENWLTARTLAEAMVAASLALHFMGRRNLALLLAATALAIHPIMALPGVLLLLCMRLPLRIGVLGLGLGVATALGMAVEGSLHPRSSGLLTVFDPAWLEVVKERSQFLFLQYWTADDWEVNSRPFAYLAFYALVVDGRLRKLCIAAMMVGAGGLMVALVAGLMGPAILVQGQAWRWTWLTAFVSVLLLAPVTQTVWRDEKCGPICALLLILGWTFSVMDYDLCVALAAALWLVRNRVDAGAARYLRWAAAALGLVVAAWLLANSWTTLFSASPETGRDPVFIADLRNIFGLGVSAAAVVLLLHHVIRSSASIVVLASMSAALIAVAAVTLPGSLMRSQRDGTPSEVGEFADWRAVIPAAATVYVVPLHNSAAFAWFTLERPSYLSVDQSAGVVFSRATAFEVERRSEVLRSLMDPDWRLLTQNLQRHAGKKIDNSPKPLTREGLVGICGDPVLDFVVAKENVGFDPLVHAHAGNWKNWNLYDCRRVRSQAAA